MLRLSVFAGRSIVAEMTGRLSAYWGVGLTPLVMQSSGVEELGEGDAPSSGTVVIPGTFTNKKTMWRECQKLVRQLQG